MRKRQRTYCLHLYWLQIHIRQAAHNATCTFCKYCWHVKSAIMTHTSPRLERHIIARTTAHRTLNGPARQHNHAKPLSHALQPTRAPHLQQKAAKLHTLAHLIIRHSITTTLWPSPWPMAGLRSLARPQPLRRPCSQAGCCPCNQADRHARVSSYKHLVPLLPKRAHMNSLCQTGHAAA